MLVVPSSICEVASEYNWISRRQARTLPFGQRSAYTIPQLLQPRPKLYQQQCSPLYRCQPRCLAFNSKQATITRRILRNIKAYLLLRVQQSRRCVADHFHHLRIQSATNERLIGAFHIPLYRDIQIFLHLFAFFQVPPSS